MLDIKFIRQNSEKVKEGCQKKQVEVDVTRVLDLDKKKKKMLGEIEPLRSEQNKISKQGIGKETIEAAKKLKEKIKSMEVQLSEVEKEFNDLMMQIPNLPFDDVPVGKDDSENIVLREKGDKPKFDFEAKDYMEIAQKFDLIDTKRAAKISGSRFGYLKNQAVLLEFALVNFALDTLAQDGFVPVIPPVIISEKAMEAMGYLSHGGEEETYHFKKDKQYFVGTSEQSIGPMFMDEVLDEKELPKRFVGFSTCFRREAGSYGKDTKGILRVHQFDKLEMFSFCHPKKSKEEHKFLLSIEEKIMKALELPYRVINICAGDLGDPAAAKYDIEVWVPSENKYRETHSTSNCTDFQARRLNTKYRDSETKKLEFIHTLNGTVFAIGRILIAILENYQQKDGSVKMPEALQKYLNFQAISKS